VAALGRRRSDCARTRGRGAGSSSDCRRAPHPIAQAFAGCRARLAGIEPTTRPRPRSLISRPAASRSSPVSRLKSYEVVARIAEDDQGLPVSRWWPVAYALPADQRRESRSRAPGPRARRRASIRLRLHCADCPGCAISGSSRFAKAIAADSKADVACASPPCVRWAPSGEPTAPPPLAASGRPVDAAQPGARGRRGAGRCQRPTRVRHTDRARVGCVALDAFGRALGRRHRRPRGLPAGRVEFPRRQRLVRPGLARNQR